MTTNKTSINKVTLTTIKLIDLTLKAASLIRAETQGATKATTTASMEIGIRLLIKTRTICTAGPRTMSGIGTWALEATSASSLISNTNKTPATAIELTAPTIKRQMIRYTISLIK